MSKNSKNATRIKAAKACNRKNGFKGPAKTQVKHNKVRAWYRIGDNNNPVKKSDKTNKAVDK